LLDTKTANEVALDAPVNDPGVRVPRRPRFDALGGHVLYLTGDDSHPTAVLRRLSDGSETDLDAGPGALSSATFSKDARYVVMQVVAHDTDGDGIAPTPVHYTDASSAPCGGAAAWFSATRATDAVSWRVVHVSDGATRDVPNFEGTFGEAVLRRTDAGSLVAEEGSATRELFPSSCGARLLHADPASDTVVVACTREGNRIDVLRGGRQIHTGCEFKDLAGLSPLSLDSLVHATCPDAPPGGDYGGLSFETGQFMSSTGGQLFERPLVSEPGTPWHRFELVRPEIHPPQVDLCSSQPVVDLETGMLHQPNERRVTMGTTTGLVLRAAGATDETRNAFAVGPLFWAPPTDAGAHCPSWERLHRTR
jgi:hypothetical protein